ncbi:hypothetical protein JIN86_18130 [Lysinibacillus sp. HST-98]|nr:hypothetical protein [Lysinibacillus sp. HST-98]EFI68895.1 hypothetical protein BFZC1_10015 [Lysinibacillus fusiformis ZC1]EKU41943.1 hypothetical protein C518_2896 [Lysinibacillus fusiformis ZB2]MBL3731509.1 hypothetical protein [Lysinibacillus sp. HST-98]
MKPQDSLFLILIAVIISIPVALLFIVFRKRKKIARIIVSIIVSSYIVFVAIYPTILSNLHAKRYDELEEYLQNTYPNEEFIIYSRNYDDAIQLGDYDVSNKSTPKIGVTYRVTKDGEIFQLDSKWYSK